MIFLLCTFSVIVIKRYIGNTIILSIVTIIIHIILRINVNRFIAISGFLRPEQAALEHGISGLLVTRVRIRNLDIKDLFLYFLRLYNLI